MGLFETTLNIRIMLIFRCTVILAPLYNIRFFGHNFKQFGLWENSIRGKFKGGMSNYSGSKILNRTLCLVEAVRDVNTIENVVWLLGGSVLGLSV